MENEAIDLTESGGDAAPLLQEVGEVMFGLDGVNDLPLLGFESEFSRSELNSTWTTLHSLVDDIIGDGGQHPVSLIFSDLLPQLLCLLSFFTFLIFLTSWNYTIFKWYANLIYFRYRSTRLARMRH